MNFLNSISQLVNEATNTIQGLNISQQIERATSFDQDDGSPRRGSETRGSASGSRSSVESYQGLGLKPPSISSSGSR